MEEAVTGNNRWPETSSTRRASCWDVQSDGVGRRASRLLSWQPGRWILSASNNIDGEKRVPKLETGVLQGQNEPSEGLCQGRRFAGCARMTEFITEQLFLAFIFIAAPPTLFRWHSPCYGWLVGVMAPDTVTVAGAVALVNWLSMREWQSL